MGLFNNRFAETIPQSAARKLAEAQFAPGVTVRMNPHNFRVEYITAAGETVPDYNYFLKKEHEKSENLRGE